MKATALALVLLGCGLVLSQTVDNPLVLVNGYPTVVEIPDDEWFYFVYTVPEELINQVDLGQTLVYTQVYDLTSSFVADTFFLKGENFSAPDQTDFPVGFPQQSGERSFFVNVNVASDNVVSYGILADCNSVCQTVTTTIGTVVYHAEPQYGSWAAPIELFSGNFTVPLELTTAHPNEFTFEVPSRDNVYLVARFDGVVESLAMYVGAVDAVEFPDAGSAVSTHTDVDEEGLLRSGKLRLEAGSYKVSLEIIAGGGAPTTVNYVMSLGIGSEPVPSGGSPGVTAAIILGILAFLCMVVAAVAGFILYQKNNAETTNSGGSGGRSRQAPAVSANSKTGVVPGGRDEEEEVNYIAKSEAGQKSGAPSSSSSSKQAARIKELEEENAKLRAAIRDARGIKTEEASKAKGKKDDEHSSSVEADSVTSDGHFGA